MAALGNCRSELEVASARAAWVQRQSLGTDDGHAAPGWPSLIGATPAGSLPPRAVLLRGMTRTRDAVDSAGPNRARLLQAATADLDAIADTRRWWGESDAARAYLAYVADGPASPRARAALVRSYRAAGFLRGAAPWRIRFAASIWPTLDRRTQDAVARETAWLAQASPTSYAYATGLVAGTPVEPRVAALLADAD